MAYEKRTWVSGVTKCSAENFNHMEDGIETAQKGVDELNTKISAFYDWESSGYQFGDVTLLRASNIIIQFGVSSNTTDNTGKLSVTFNKKFALAPTVITNAVFISNAKVNTTISDVTAYGFSVYFSDPSEMLKNSSQRVEWVAIGKPA